MQPRRTVQMLKTVAVPNASSDENSHSDNVADSTVKTCHDHDRTKRPQSAEEM